MATIQCPKCTAWMDDAGQCPFCGYAFSEDEKQKHEVDEKLLNDLHHHIESSPEPIKKLANSLQIEKGLESLFQFADQADKKLNQSSLDNQSSNDPSQLFNHNNQTNDNHPQSKAYKDLMNTLPAPIRLLLNRKIIILIVCIPFILSLLSIAFNLLFIYNQRQSSNAQTLSAECKTKADWLEDHECWWSSGYWSESVDQDLYKYEQNYYKSLHQACAQYHHCPRNENATDKLLPKWQSMTYKDLDIKLINYKQPNCQVKAASRHHQPGSHYAANNGNEEVKLYIINIGNGYKHEVWLSVNNIETRSGNIEIGGFAEGSRVFLGIDNTYWFDKRINRSNSNHVLVGEESFYQELLRGNKLYVTFAVPDTRDKAHKTPMIISYRVFGLDNMKDVCNADAGRIGESQ